MLSSLFIDANKCTGCRLCEAVCSLRHAGVCNPARARLRVIRFEDEGLDVPMMCQQCSKPVCVDICPAAAISKDKDTGLVTTDASRCIGCKLCVMTCPFAGPSVDADGTIIRCDLCDGEPRCAKFCQTGAIRYERADLSSLQRKREALKSLKSFYSMMLDDEGKSTEVKK